MVKTEITKKAKANARQMMAALGSACPVFITDSIRVPDPVSVIRGLPADAIIICRDYDHPGREALAAMLRDETFALGQTLLIAADTALARLVGADGVHLPEYMLGRLPCLTGFSFVSAACHSRRALHRAEQIGIDLAMVSPVFPTRSHEGAATLGLHRFARLVAKARIPVAALGGITPTTAKKLRPLQVAAFAAIDGFVV
ncbi:MAG: thiamine phosphate synthase [Alphaproteobacteria bacterium]|nr:thiamine phosphate synthase [Alphaproteobacteria bacterium]